MQRNIEHVIALTGIIKAGAAYIPFDPEYPKERLDYMYADSGVPIVLTHKVIGSIVFPAGVVVIFLDEKAMSEVSDEDDVSPEFRGRLVLLFTWFTHRVQQEKPEGVVDVA